MGSIPTSHPNNHLQLPGANEAPKTATMQLRASFFGTAGDMAFTGFVYQMGGTLHRAQIRFVPKDAPTDATMPIPGARRSPRHVVEGNDLDEVIAKSRALIEQEVGSIAEFKQVTGKS